MKNIITSIVVLLLLSSCRDNNLDMRWSDVLKERGVPALFASDFKLKSDDRGNHKVVFYNLIQVTESSLKPVPDNMKGVFVFTRDERFTEHVKYHFDNLLKRGVAVPSTMFGSAEPGGTPIEIFQFNEKGCRLVFEGEVRVAYFVTQVPGEN